MRQIIYNKEIGHKFETLETFEAGLVLTGPETKSIKAAHVSLKGSYIIIKPDNTAWLVNAHVSKYKPATAVQAGYHTEQARKLLLNKKELAYLRGKLTQKGLTIVPVKLYTIRSLIKLEIALVRSIKKHDKRERLKKKTIDRDIQRALKRHA